MASLSEIYAFGRLFQNSDLGSPEGFKQFLEHFRLEKFFRYDDNVCHSLLLRAFGDLMRRVLKGRPAIFEGQHRGKLINAFFNGILHPKQEIPNYVVPWRDAKEADFPLDCGEEVEITIGDEVVVDHKGLRRCQALKKIKIFFDEIIGNR